MIEGYTDSSRQRQPQPGPVRPSRDAVRAALVAWAWAGSQLLAQGYGEMHPVADNDSAGGGR